VLRDAEHTAGHGRCEGRVALGGLTVVPTLVAYHHFSSQGAGLARFPSLPNLGQVGRYIHVTLLCEFPIDERATRESTYLARVTRLFIAFNTADPTVPRHRPHERHYIATPDGPVVAREFRALHGMHGGFSSHTEGTTRHSAMRPGGTAARKSTALRFNEGRRKRTPSSRRVTGVS